MNEPRIDAAPSARLEKVLVLLPDADGHRATYVRHVLAAAGQDRAVSLAVTAASAGHEAFSAQLGAAPGAAGSLPLDSFDAASIAAAARTHGFTRIVAPDGDALALEIGRTGTWDGPPLRILMMREHAQARSSRLLTWVVERARARRVAAARRVPGVTVLTLRAPYDERPVDAACAVDPVELLATPDDRAAWRARLGLADDVTWVAIVGANDERKRADVVIAAVRALGPGYGLLAAGRTDAPTRAALATATDLRAVVLDRYLEDAEVDGAILAADVVAAAYANDGPSGIVAKALALGTPPVVAPTRAIRRALASGRSPVVVADDATAPALAQGFARAAALGRVTDSTGEAATPRAFALALLGATDG
ncbi:glycosyltransferase [Demequina soli]|uniref:glycosyltransferase n=1 Tax=Demequina soli TaxID=1638987 RepID=UPI000784FD3B|nr:hypothetical protein [Demequina soli]